MAPEYDGKYPYGEELKGGTLRTTRLLGKWFASFYFNPSDVPSETTVGVAEREGTEEEARKTAVANGFIPDEKP